MTGLNICDWVTNKDFNLSQQSVTHKYLLLTTEEIENFNKTWHLELRCHLATGFLHPISMQIEPFWTKLPKHSLPLQTHLWVRILRFERMLYKSLLLSFPIAKCGHRPREENLGEYNCYLSRIYCVDRFQIKERNEKNGKGWAKNLFVSKLQRENIFTNNLLWKVMQLCNMS